MPNTNTTTAPATYDNLELLSLADCHDQFRLKRGYINRLVASGKVKSVSLRERGKMTGRRLIFAASLRAYILSHVED